MKDFALGLALKQRRKATRKSPICIQACFFSFFFLPRDQSLPAQPINIREAQPRKKAQIPLRTSCISQTNVSAMFDNHKLLLF